MEALIVNGTEFSPTIIFDPTTLKFELSGESRPENSGKFYEPVIKWIEQYESVLFWQKNKFEKQHKIIFEIKLEYFNSVSAKYIMEILTLLNKFYSAGYDVQVKWYYDQLDTDMKESGEEFAKLLKIPFEVISNN